MAGMRLSELDFKSLMPVFMQSDEAVKALCSALNKVMGKPVSRIDTIRTWDQYNSLSESECDEMAYELDIDWYDSSATLDEKRKTIQYAQQIKRKRGTKWAVERLVSAYFGDGKVTEWYEEDEPGTPFTFSIVSYSPKITSENYNKFLEAVGAAKNERSHISSMTHIWWQNSELNISISRNKYEYGFLQCGTQYCGGVKYEV